MKTKIIICLVVLCSFITFGQQLELEKASPFTAVKWENGQPIVQFKDTWYHFEKLDHFSKEELISYCKKEFGPKWKKRFSEDLVEVLQGLNYIPNTKVELELSKDGVSKLYTGTFTYENRQRCLMFNDAQEASKSNQDDQAKQVKTISKMDAISDLQAFKDILDSKSSYAQLSNYDYTTEIKNLIATILKEEEDVNVDVLANEMSKIMSEIGDRHSSVKNESFNKKSHETYNLKLPFGIVMLDGNLIALKQTNDKEQYAYYLENYPLIKSINGITINTLLDTYNYRHKKAPKDSKLSRGALAIQNYGALLFRNNESIPEHIQVVFSNGETDKKEVINLTTEQKGYTPKLAKESFISEMNVIQKKQFKSLSSILDTNIGYFKIPMMFHPQDIEGLEPFIKNTMNSFLDTKALIIDIRENPGGGREILQIFASYLVQPEQSPWVANVAYLRTDKDINYDERSMSNRYLHTYNSDEFSNKDRKAIDDFNTHFNTQKTFEKVKFSSPFYMILNAGNTSYTKPVYIIVNENSFSAATVFTSAFKSLPNIKIVGVTTDGSSGNSKTMYVGKSGIRVKVSTMLSFQRNGKTLDGNGTEPDIYIPTDSEQIFTGKDTQLEKLIKIINTHN